MAVQIKVFGQQWAIMDGGLSAQFSVMYNDTISNKLYFHGGFQYAGGLNVNGIASWDGIKWDSLGPGKGGNAFWGPGNGFLIRYKNKLYLQSNSYRIYAWDFATQKWDSVPGGKVSGSIYCATIYNNDLILAGQFAGTGTVTAKNVMGFDGTSFYAVGTPTFNGYVRSVTVYKNEIYIAGNFAGDTIHNGIARWNGIQWRDCKGGVIGGGGPDAGALCVYNNRLFVGGYFYGTKDGPSPSIVTWDSTKWSNIGGVHYSGFPWGGVTNLFTHKKKLYVFGSFDWAGDQHVNAPIAIWNDTCWCSSKAVIPTTTLWLATTYKNEFYVATSGNYLASDSVNYVGRWTGATFIDSCSMYTNIVTIPNPSGIKIYPNPVSNILYISTEQNELENSEIEITNCLGQTVLKIPYKNEIDVSDLSSGCYFIRVIADSKQQFHSKFIRQ